MPTWPGPAPWAAGGCNAAAGGGTVWAKGAARVDGLEGRRSLELITALYESIETNTDVQAAMKAAIRP